MGHFDFPRLHFFGQALIDPATGNNNFHYPLVTFEPLSGTVVIPPRIYLDDPQDFDLVDSEDIEIKRHIHYDDSGTPYLLLYSINEPETFKNWNITPLGEHNSDREFHSLYARMITRKEMKPLLGQHPGYWNYFGTMNFKLEKVHIHAVQIFENQELKSFVDGTRHPAIDPLLGAELTFTDIRGRNSAIMIDLAPTLSIYSQVFCDHVLIKKGEQILLSGKPFKASLRQMNPYRMPGDSSISGSSGIFCTSIPFDQMDEEISNDLIRFFRHYGNRSLPLKGLFLRFDLYDIEEDQNPDYKNMGKVSNPARSAIAGSLTPWYEGEMETAWSGRLLLPKHTLLRNYNLGPVVANYDSTTHYLSFDLLGSIPLIKEPSTGIIKFAELGEMVIGLKTDSGKYELAYFNLGDQELNFDLLQRQGGMLDVHLSSPELAKHLLDPGGRLYLQRVSTNHTRDQQLSNLLLEELPFRILTDQVGIYADQGEDPHFGFRSNRSTREICQMRVFKQGVKYEDVLPVMCVEVILKPYVGDYQLRVHEMEDFKDGKEMFWPTDKPGVRFYAFIPSEEGLIPADIMHYMLITGNFVNLRVLPEFLWEYTDSCSQPGEKKSQVNFDLIYRQFLMHYDLIYPSSGIITPFNQGYLSKIRDYMIKLMSDDAWDQYRYMPSTRDLPKGKRKLFIEWLDIVAKKTSNEIKS